MRIASTLKRTSSPLPVVIVSMCLPVYVTIKYSAFDLILMFNFFDRPRVVDMSTSLRMYLCFFFLGEIVSWDDKIQPCDSSQKGIFIGRACNVSDGEVCRKYWEGPSGGINTFDNIVLAMLTISQCITMAGWTDIMYSVSKSRKDCGQSLAKPRLARLPPRPMLGFRRRMLVFQSEQCSLSP